MADLVIDRVMNAAGRLARRELLWSACAGAALTLGGAATAATPRKRSAGDGAAMLGKLDLREVAAIDTHVHPPRVMTTRQAEEVWGHSFAAAALFAGGAFDAEPSQALATRYSGLYQNLSFSVGLRNYVARTYGVEPTQTAVDVIIQREMRGGPTPYLERKMAAERIDGVVLQSGSTDPVRPTSAFPNDKIVWTFSIAPLIQPDWARLQGVRDIDDFSSKVLDVVSRCAANGCRGIKLVIAYYRPLDIRKVSRREAQAALDKVLAAKPLMTQTTSTFHPVFDSDEVTEALWRYQDYILRKLFVLAPQLALNIIIHTAVAAHPGLRLDYNDTRPLYNVFADPELLEAGTRFVLIHTGYPQHYVVGAFISQFPTVYTDLSFVSHQPESLEEALRVFFGYAPFGKIMHGSDWSDPEQIGYAVDNSRRALAHVINEHRSVFGWSAADCERMARGVLCETAREVFRMP